MTEKRTLVFYLVVMLVIVVSSISILWLPPGYSIAKGLEAESRPPMLAFLPFFAYITLILMPVIYKKYEKEQFVWGRRFLKGAYLGFILITMVFLTELASGLIQIEDITPGIQNVLLGGIIMQGIVALGEELPFRGYILPDLMKRYGAWKAVFYSSLFFSVLHIPSVLTLGLDRNNVIIMLLTISVAEILLALCYLYDGLKMSIGFHFTWNYFQYHVYSLRQDFGGILEINSEHALITGGTFGPEAGLLGMFVVILALVIVLWWMQIK